MNGWNENYFYDPSRMAMSKQAMRREQWLKDLKPGEVIPYEKRAEPSRVMEIVGVGILIALWIVVFTN